MKKKQAINEAQVVALQKIAGITKESVAETGVVEQGGHHNYGKRYERYEDALKKALRLYVGFCMKSGDDEKEILSNLEYLGVRIIEEISQENPELPVGMPKEAAQVPNAAAPTAEDAWTDAFEKALSDHFEAEDPEGYQKAVRAMDHIDVYLTFAENGSVDPDFAAKEFYDIIVSPSILTRNKRAKIKIQKRKD